MNKIKVEIISFCIILVCLVIASLSNNLEYVDILKIFHLVIGILFILLNVISENKIYKSCIFGYNKASIYVKNIKTSIINIGFICIIVYILLVFYSLKHESFIFENFLLNFYFLGCLLFINMFILLFYNRYKGYKEVLAIGFVCVSFIYYFNMKYFYNIVFSLLLIGLILLVLVFIRKKALIERNILWI